MGTVINEYHVPILLPQIGNISTLSVSLRVRISLIAPREILLKSYVFVFDSSKFQTHFRVDILCKIIM